MTRRMIMPVFAVLALAAVPLTAAAATEGCAPMTDGQRDAARSAGDVAQKIACVLAEAEAKGPASKAIATACEIPITDTALKLVGTAAEAHLAGISRARAAAARGEK